MTNFGLPERFGLQFSPDQSGLTRGMSRQIDPTTGKIFYGFQSDVWNLSPGQRAGVDDEGNPLNEIAGFLTSTGSQRDTFSAGAPHSYFMQPGSDGTDVPYWLTDSGQFSMKAPPKDDLGRNGFFGGLADFAGEVMKTPLAVPIAAATAGALGFGGGASGGAANTFGLEAGAGLGTGGGSFGGFGGLATTGGSAAGGGEMIFPDILDFDFPEVYGAANPNYGGAPGFGPPTSAPINFDDYGVGQDVSLPPGTTAPSPTVSVPGYGDIYGSPASILKSITQGGLPTNLLKSIMGGSGASGGAGGSGSGTGMGWLDDILKGLGGPAGVLGKGVASAGILAAMEDAKSGGQIDTSRLESSFDRFDPASLTGAYDMASGAGRTELATNLARRGVSGSSFGNADLSNYDMTRDVGRQAILGQGVATQADIANKILQAQIAAKKNQNDLYGRSLLALGSVFQPKSQFSL